jgi:hypothetical protein
LMLSIGVNHKELYVDSALSGGLYSQQMSSSPAVELFLRSRAQRWSLGLKFSSRSRGYAT